MTEINPLVAFIVLAVLAFVVIFFQKIKFYLAGAIVAYLVFLFVINPGQDLRDELARQSGVVSKIDCFSQSLGVPVREFSDCSQSRKKKNPRANN